MKRGRILMTAGALLVALVGCGDDGGGGDEAAFCDALDELSDQVADGDIAGDIGGVVDTVNDLIADAPSGEPLEASQAVGDEVAALDDDDEGDVADATEVIQDELGPQIEDLCGEDAEEFAVAPEIETTTTTEPDETTTTTEPDETTTTTDPDETTTSTVEGDGAIPPVNARQPVPADIDPAFADLAQFCFDGDMAACDDLFGTTPVDSVDEAYGDSCGGRIDDGLRFDLNCIEVIVAPVLPADGAAGLGEVLDPAFTADADACFAGDQVACDVLFQSAPNPSFERTYGAVCGGRVPTAAVLCVDIFGELAFL